jgi:hypothetical protein
MSEPTDSAPASRPSVVAMLLGLVVVAAVLAGALAIEQATDNDLDLPDSLPGGLRADEPLPDAAVDAGRELEATLDETVALRTYVDAGREINVTLTVIDAEAGPFAPDGPQPMPEALGLERAGTELVEDDGVLCRLAWGRTVVDGDELPDADPVGVFCQLGAHGRTYWLNGRGVSVDDAVEILESVAD